MSVKVMGEKLADTRSKVSLAPSDRLRLDACALFGEAAAVASPPLPPPAPLSISLSFSLFFSLLSHFIPFLSLSLRDEVAAGAVSQTILIDPILSPNAYRY